MSAERRRRPLAVPSRASGCKRISNNQPLSQTAYDDRRTAAVKFPNDCRARHAERLTTIRHCSIFRHRLANLPSSLTSSHSRMHDQNKLAAAHEYNAARSRWPGCWFHRHASRHRRPCSQVLASLLTSASGWMQVKVMSGARTSCGRPPTIRCVTRECVIFCWKLMSLNKLNVTVRAAFQLHHSLCVADGWLGRLCHQYCCFVKFTEFIETTTPQSTRVIVYPVITRTHQEMR